MEFPSFQCGYGKGKMQKCWQGSSIQKVRLYVQEAVSHIISNFSYNSQIQEKHHCFIVLPLYFNYPRQSFYSVIYMPSSKTINIYIKIRNYNLYMGYLPMRYLVFSHSFTKTPDVYVCLHDQSSISTLPREEGTGRKRL